MDLLNFVLSIVIIYIALQAGQAWIIFAMIILSVLTLKSWKTALALVVSAVVIYFAFSTNDFFSNFPLVLIGLLIVGLILGIGDKPAEQSPMDFGGLGGFGDPYGGMGGY